MTRPTEEPASPWLDAAVELLGRSGSRGTIRLRDDASSMAPSLSPGQRVEVEFGIERLSTGDILLFRQADYLVVHRLLGRARPFPDGRPALRTRGDARTRLDPRVDPSSVVGRVVAIEDGATWRDLGSRGARLLARAIAWHGLWWAALAVVARRVGPRSHDLVARVDRALLSATHTLFFRVACRRLERPPAGAL